MSLRETLFQKTTLDATNVFATHSITKTSDRRWLMQRKYPESDPDGRLDWTFAAEVIVLEGGGLYVGGDIQHVVFAHGPADPLQRLRWMGECNDVQYYAAQKARIGMGRKACIHDWDAKVACEDLTDYFIDWKEGLDEPLTDKHFDEQAYERALQSDERDAFMEHVNDAFRGEAWESADSFGEVLSPVIIYAHAALTRLCVLLREQDIK